MKRAFVLSEAGAHNRAKSKI